MERSSVSRKREIRRNNMKYDYLIVGSGLYGATVAHEAKKAGKEKGV